MSGRTALAFKPEEVSHIVDEVGEADLGRARAKPTVRTKSSMRATCSAKTYPMDARTADFLTLALAVCAGIGAPRGFLR